MKRTQDKIKDLVEPQEFDDVRDFAAHPARALAAYRFTDATSDLLARWLDALADLPPGRGTAHALAGMRGVGKSPTRTPCGARGAAGETQRTHITDPPGATSARRLANRRHTLVPVARGTRPTLQDELTEAFFAAFGGSKIEWSLAPAPLLAKALAQSRGTTTLIILIDTAYGREAHVKRDDGPLLSELGLAALDSNTFIALALDDDIAGAEGVNAALARTFQIDYLEPEHLYHIANIYLLRKNAPARGALHDIYLTLRQTVPNFNWSEPRFAALYPIHPLIAETAASVRLYDATFAFLPFAAAAARSAINRPALSLILLDEVFDRSERGLRHSEELQDAFRIFDNLASNAVALFPAMQRLQVRLVLKSLFVMSLDGRGATARDLCAALLFQDERSMQAAVERVEEMLKRLVAFAPRGGLSVQTDGEEVRYRFSMSASADFEDALAKASTLASIEPEAVAELLRSLPRTRFADWPFDQATATPDAPALDFQVTWRGSSRPGQLLFVSRSSTTTDAPGFAPPVGARGAGEEYDWQMLVLEAGANAAAVAPRAAGFDTERGQASAPISISWQPAEATAEELNVLRRLVALQSDPQFAEFGETARAAANTLAAQAGRIWSRLYVDDGLLIFMDSRHIPFTDEARTARTFAALLGQALAPLFTERFPQHPHFTEPLGETETTHLVDNLFSGANVAEQSVQRLAELYAAPLGLATRRGDILIAESGDAVLGVPWVREALTLVDRAEGAVVPLAKVDAALRGEPYGLLRQAQYLILAALVAQRRLELATTSGDRISRRTLGAAIKWDDVAGVCRAAEIHHNAQELTNWAQLLTGDETLPSIAEANARESVRAALAAWLKAWRAETVLKEFDQLPDAGLTTRAWNLSANVRRTFGAAADTVEAALAGNLSLEEGLQRVADTFAAAPAQLAQSASQLAALRVYVAGIVRRENVRAYLVAAEPTGLEEIESARRELLLIAEDPHNLFDPSPGERFELLWQGFHARYTAHYIGAHARAVGDASDHASLDEFTRGAAWRDFEALAALPFVNPQLWEEATQLLAEVKNARCALPVAELLTTEPRCACAFQLSRAEVLLNATTLLAGITDRGRAAYRRTLKFYHPSIVRALGVLANEETDTDSLRRAYALAPHFSQGETPPVFTHADARLITHVIERTPPAQPLRVPLPDGLRGLITREELIARWQQWFDELPAGSALVEVTSESNNNDAA